MKIDKQKLQNAIDIVIKAMPNKATLPVLTHIVFDESESRIYCTDLEQWIFCDVKGLDFSACVPGRLFSDLIKTMTGTIEIVAKENEIIVSCGKHKSTIKTLPFEEAPHLNLGDVGLEPAKETFLMDIERVAFCAASDQSRPALTGVLVSPSGLSAADGFRLATTGYGQGVIIPAKFLSMLLSLFKGRSVNQHIDDRYATFSCGDILAVSQLIEGRYPAIDQIIPKAIDVMIVFDAKKAAQAIKTVLLFAEADRVKLSWNDGKIRVSSLGQLGEGLGEFDIMSGSEFEDFSINGKFLLDALSTMNVATMGINGPTRPIMLIEGEYQQVIMPMSEK